MKELFTRYKPGVPIRIHLLIAALIWSLVGFFLMVNGGLLLVLAEQLWLAGPAFLLGTGKALLLLDRTARNNVGRILTMQDGACIGSVYSVKSWLLVAAMIAMGRVLRSSTLLPGEMVGLLYLTVGWALFLASRLLWRSWYAHDLAQRDERT